MKAQERSKYIEYIQNFIIYVSELMAYSSYIYLTMASPITFSEHVCLHI